MSDSRPARIGGLRKVVRVVFQTLVMVFPFLLIVRETPFRAFLMPAANRTLYFKLPIEGARFHWTFLDPKTFLSGELTLRILNKGHDETIVVFRDGKISDGWEMIGVKPDSSFYFGFATTHRFRTKANDSLVITLKTPKDLHGRGPYTEGVLAAGVWQMTGTYSSLYGRRLNPMDLIVLHGDPPVAFMQCWKGVWPIVIIKAEGWKGPKAMEETGRLRRMSKHRGTNGSRCGSHI